MMKHQVYIFNMPVRKDRLKSILDQFKGKNEFNIHIIRPENDSDPRRSLWKTLCKLVQGAVNNEKVEYLIICEDDHVFTENYSPELLNLSIKNAIELKADVLLGGVSWYKYSYQVFERLFFVNEFTGLQFTVIFRKFFNVILQADCNRKPIADKLISLLSNNKFLVYPPISTQKEFGYSDVTPMNNCEGRVDYLFKRTENLLHRCHQVCSYYAKVEASIPQERIRTANVTLPIYVFDWNGLPDHLEDIERQFGKKDEFDIQVISSNGDNSHLALWNMIVKGIEQAKKNDEDFIILCKKNHVFTNNYTKEKLIMNITQAYVQRADILLGESEATGMCIPISRDRFWVDTFSNSTFIIIFKQFYQTICRYKFDGEDNVDSILSKLSVNKMILYPFISKGIKHLEHSLGVNEIITLEEKCRAHEVKYRLSLEIFDRFQPIIESRKH